MPLDFNQVYQLTNPAGNYLKSRMIALGVRERQVLAEDDQVRPCYEFLVNSDRGHSVFYEVESDDIETGVVVLRDLMKTGEDGEPVFWKFEPLTLEMFDEMGESIGGYEQLRANLLNTEAVRDYYREQYLDDWWTEHE